MRLCLVLTSRLKHEGPQRQAGSVLAAFSSSYVVHIHSHSTIVFNTVGKDGCGPRLPGTSDLAGTDVKRMNSKIKILSDGAKFLCRNGAGSYDGEDLI